jgi:hypothetical protein
MNKTNVWATLLLLSAAGCSQTPVEAQIPTGMELGWKSLPHRIAATELTAELTQDAPSIRAQNNGGDFGAMDSTTAHYQTIAIAHPGLVVEEISVNFIIEPASPDLGEDSYLQTKLIALPESLNSSENVAVFVRGFRIDTNLYDSVPSFQENESLPYDPALGYTTSGFAIGSSDPAQTQDGWTVEAFARNRLAIADREDMNAAIGDATTWIRADFLVLGLPKDVALSRADANYPLSYPEFGSQTEHPHAGPETQTITFQAEAQMPILGFGIQSFNFDINVDGRHDPSCDVISEETNFWNQDISGPGRYLREFTAKLDQVSHQEDGSVQALFDLHISNSSAMNEVGNICAGLSGRAILIQAPDATEPTIVDRRLQFESGVMVESLLNE